MAGDGTIVQRVATLVTEHLEVLDRQGKSLGKLPVADGDFQARALSPDGQQLVIVYQKPGDNTLSLFMLDLARGIFSRFSFDSEGDQTPAWTPDGRRLIWGSDRPGGRNFYWKRADGSGGEELFADVPGPLNDVNDVTPDGRWIVYRSDESGEFELYAQSFPALGHKVRLTINGAFKDIQKGTVMTRWRSDGREILCFSPDGRTVMSIPVTPGAELTAGAPVPLFKLPPEVDVVTPSPDGQKFYACVANQTFSRGLIRLVKNWATPLR